MNKIKMHGELLKKLATLYSTKNADYGDSVSETYKRYGLTSFLVRMEDKLNRVRTLDKQDAKVSDEKLEDTLLDLANYALLAIIELQANKKCEVNCEWLLTEENNLNN